jgi:glycosyltransferase involved in cell wall biosynthesis
MDDVLVAPTTAVEDAGMTLIERVSAQQDRRNPARRLDPPTVLFVSPVADLKGGAERVLLDLLANPGIRPALATPGEGELARLARERGWPLVKFELGKVASIRRPPRPGEILDAASAGVACARQLAAAAKQLGAVLMHTNGLKAHIIGAMARILYGTPVLAHMHDIPHTRLEKAIWVGIARAVTRTVLVSSPCYPAARLSSRVAVVSNGVRHHDVWPASPRPPPSCPTIGFVGRFHPFKGVDVLLDWFEYASVARPELRLQIRGRADEEGTAYWESLRGRIDGLIHQGRCRLLDWAEPGQDPYEGIDILVVPSVTPDPAPLVVLEAMSRAIPVIGYPAGGIPFLIGGSAHGALASSPVEFEAALDRLLDPSTYEATARAASKRVRDSFTVERFWDGINAQYALAGAPIGGADFAERSLQLRPS